MFNYVTKDNKLEKFGFFQIDRLSSRFFSEFEKKLLFFKHYLPQIITRLQRVPLIWSAVVLPALSLISSVVIDSSNLCFIQEHNLTTEVKSNFGEHEHIQSVVIYA